MTYINNSDKWATQKNSEEFNVYTATITLGYKIEKLHTIVDEEAKEVDTEELKATILRTGNVSDKSLNTDLGKSRYRVLKLGEKTVDVQIDGKYSKLYRGTFKDAESADAANSKDVKIYDSTDENITITFDYLGDDKPQTFSLYSSSMGRWIQYSISFKDGVCIHDYKNGICTKCGELNVEASDAVKTTETNVAIDLKDTESVVIPLENKANFASKTLELTTKAGAISFDKDAVARIFGSIKTDVKFEMKDLKEDAKYKDSDYDVVLDLKFTDEDGNNLFKEAANGKATITVPYAKEVAEGKTVKVFYINGDEKEEVEATYDAEAKTIAFTVSHFSTYAVEQVDKAVDTNTEKDSTETAPNTGDSSMMLMYISLMLLASFGIVYSVKANRA